MHASLADMVVRLAASAPDQPIYTFLYSDRGDETITAGQLHRGAGAIAAVLDEQGVRPGEILPLAFDHGYELVAAFWGAIYLGAVPTILPYIARSHAYLDHIARLTRFASAPTVVTTEATRPYLEHGLAGAACRVVALPSGLLDGASGPLAAWPAHAPSDPPYIQFSSGTTGAPKGVILSHAALLHYCRASAEHFAATADDVSVGWLPLYHDMGLATQIFEPLFVPHLSVMMSPDAWLREPHRLFEAVHRLRGTITWMPNFAFRYCLRRIRDEQIAAVDLSSWRILGNASEPVLVEDLEAFAGRFARHGLHAGALAVSYGMAEHVAGITWTPPGRAPDVDWVSLEGLEAGRATPTAARSPRSRPIVSCGHPIPAVALRIANEAGDALAERTVGEILVRSPMVFTGYYDMPEESAAARRDGWLHTGDLGYLAGGQLFVCGRQKDLIIVGGRNVYPSHLETIATSVLGEQGRFAAAFGVPNPQLGTERPVVVCEMRQRPDEATCLRLQQAIRERLQQAVQVFVGDVRLVEPGWILRTTSGKVNRAATREKYLQERAHDAAHGAATRPAGPTPTLRTLVGIWQTLFNQEGIDPDADFFALGGDSLLAVQLTLAIEERFQCTLPSTALLDAPTIAGLAALLDDPSRRATHQTLVPLESGEPASQRPAVFCVHGLGGGVLDYRPLSRALGAQQPFYALQARALDGGRPIDPTIEAMAAHYVEAVRAFQPRGPYCLAGYCFGGVVAYEMGRQLVALGERVALVAILEGYAPDAVTQPSALRREWQFAVHFVRALPYWIRDYLRLGRMRRQARNRRLIRVARKRLARLVGLQRELEIEDMLDGVTSAPAHRQQVLVSHVAAARQYAPTPYAARLVLFRTAQRLLQAPALDMGWSQLSTEKVDVEMVDGAHDTILQEPYVQVLAERLRLRLSAVERGSAPTDPR